MTLPPARPGLRKARRPPLLNSREVRLVSSSDVRVGELFETADVVSEGASRVDGKQRAYFGSSNIILLIGSEETREGLDRVAQVLARDPHVRLRAMRLARREAAQRANGPLERLRSAHHGGSLSARRHGARRCRGKRAPRTSQELARLKRNRGRRCARRDRCSPWRRSLLNRKSVGGGGLTHVMKRARSPRVIFRGDTLV